MSDFDTDVINEIENVYRRIGKLQHHFHHTSPSDRGCESEVSMLSHMKRCDDITKYLEGEGYKYDWFKGWTK
jgi:hypothetical protein